MGIKNTLLYENQLINSDNKVYLENDCFENLSVNLSNSEFENYNGNSGNNGNNENNYENDNENENENEEIVVEFISKEKMTYFTKLRI